MAKKLRIVITADGCLAVGMSLAEDVRVLLGLDITQHGNGSASTAPMPAEEAVELIDLLKTYTFRKPLSFRLSQ